jgi:hypothetical protein
MNKFYNNKRIKSILISYINNKITLKYLNYLIKYTKAINNKV